MEMPGTIKAEASYVHAEPFAESTGPYYSVQASVQRCPVCEGKGTVAPGFYSHVSDRYVTMPLVPTTCRSCDGKGYIVVK